MVIDVPVIDRPHGLHDVGVHLARVRDLPPIAHQEPAIEVNPAHASGFRSDFGWMVEIEHGNGLTTRYAHASKLLVQQGAVVTPGERIAAVGSTGRSTGPHLHFEVLRRGGALDPKQYLAGI